MKGKLIFSETSKAYGFSTMEMIVAFTIIILCLSAVISLIFNGQILGLDSENDAMAIRISQDALESSNILARQDFYSISTIATTTQGIFQKELAVEDVDDFSKLISSNVIWGDSVHHQSLSFNLLLTNPLDAQSGMSCNFNPVGNWQNPHITNYGLSAVAGDSAGLYPITFIKVFQQKLYVAVSNTGSSTNPTLFIFDISNPVSPILKGSLDNSPTTVTGINSLQVFGNYLYAASARNIAKTDPTFGQLQIIDISSSTHPFIKFNFPVPGVTSGGVGRSIFYRNGFVYLGLSSTSGTGPEFNIIDVKNFPTTTPAVVGKFTVGSGVESIYVRGNYAYLATDDHGKELMVLNISSSTNPTLAGYFDAAGSGGLGNGDGKALFLSQNKLYLGRTYINNGPEFYVIDLSHVSPSSSAPSLGLNDLGPNSTKPFSLNSLVVRNNLAFLLTGSGTKGGSFEVFDVASPSNFASSSPLSTLLLPGGQSGAGGSSMDCIQSIFYSGSVDSSGKGYLSVINGG